MWAGLDGDGAAGINVRATDRHAATAGARHRRDGGAAAHHTGVPLPPGEAAG